MKRFFTLFIILCGSVLANGAVLAGWDVSTQTGGTNNFGTSPLAATTVGSNVTVGSLTRASGVSTTGAGAARALGGLVWNYTTPAAAITANAFFTFTIKANSCNSMSLSSVSTFDYRRSGTGAVSGLIQYSINGGTYTDITTVSFSSSASGGASIAAIDLTTITALQNVLPSSTVTFRIVPYGASANTGTFYIYDKANTNADDFAITGTTSALTPPTTSVLAGATTICAGTSTNLTTTITGGTSPYTVVYSGGTILNYSSGVNIPVSPTTTTPYSLTSVTDANGCASTGVSGSPTVTVDAITNAGADQTINSSSFTITGNTPTQGTGQWSIVTHNSTTTPTITDFASSTTTVTGISANKSATLQWTITGGVCSPAFDQVVLNNSTPLRVELTILKAAKGSNNHNYLTWQTATEQNSSLFNIERSTNGQTNWKTIGTVKAAGNSQTTRDYQYTDEAPLSISYYRLRSVDFDGKEQLSNVVSVQQKAGGKLKVFPTAATDKLVISTDNDEVQPYSVFDMLSRNVQTGSVLGQKEINIGSLPVGTYFVKVGAETVKFLKK